LKSIREIWKAEALIKKIRQIAKGMITSSLEEQKNFISGLAKFGIVGQGASIDDVLALDKKNILDRRIQTVILKLGLANTPKQARQFITHGHVYIKGKKINVPSYLVKIDEENQISIDIKKALKADELKQISQ